jgi:hypothetical protein
MYLRASIRIHRGNKYQGEYPEGNEDDHSEQNEKNNEF